MQKGQDGALQVVRLSGEGRDVSGCQQGEVREGCTDRGVEAQTGLGTRSAYEPSLI